MHELGIMTGVVESVEQAARDAGAERVCKVSLSVGEMTEAIADALYFSFDILKEGTLMEDADLEITMIAPRSRCLECGVEYDHDRFHAACPECESPFTELIAGRELTIDSIEVDLPD